jgi:NADPH-dependent 2,4-dienoyl-CoA reductase/sulfur reductase-like enzyme
MIVERDRRLGGVLGQCIHDGFGVLEFGERLTGPEYACRCVHEVKQLGIPVRTGAFVHTLEPAADGWDLSIITEAGISQVRSASVVMATGCRERTDRQVFLHGDRPAGIFTAGQAQRLINIDGAMPGRDVVVLGSGDIGLIMARRFTLEGAHVRGVFEIRSEPSGLARNVAQCLEDWDIPLHLETTVTEVHGRDRVSAVTVCDVRDGQPDRTSAREVPCDTLVISVGLIPEDDMLVDLGLEIDPGTGAVPVSQNREAALPGLFVCGNASIVYDLVDYVAECGRAAGRAAAGFAAGGVCDNPGRVVPMVCGANIAQLVPQRLRADDAQAPVLFVRTSRSADRGELVVTSNGQVLSRRQLRYQRTAEMIRHPLEPAAWEYARIDGGELVVSLEVRNGT